jgi:hypothetical protein
MKLVIYCYSRGYKAIDASNYLWRNIKMNSELEFSLRTFESVRKTAPVLDY